MFWNKKRKLSLIDLSVLSKMEQQEIKRLFVRAFASEDGKKALAYLRHFTSHRSFNPETSNETLRFMEGQRALINTIQKLSDHNKN